MVSNSLTKSTQRMGITAYLSKDAVKAQLEQAIGKNSDRFITSIISAVTQNPELAECSNGSIVSAALIGQSLGLSPSPQLGQYYLVPFNDRNAGIKKAQFQMGYRGMYQLAIRSGQYRRLDAIAIKEGELESYDPLTGEIKVRLIEDVDAREDAPTIGYYAYFELVNGFKKSMYWTRRKMERHAERYSMGYKAHKGYTFWEKDFDGMAVKTMYRQLLKLAPASIDIETALEADGSLIDADGQMSAPTVEVEEIPAEHEKAPQEAAQGPQKATDEVFG